MSSLVKYIAFVVFLCSLFTCQPVRLLVDYFLLPANAHRSPADSSLFSHLKLSQSHMSSLVKYIAFVVFLCSLFTCQPVRLLVDYFLPPANARRSPADSSLFSHLKPSQSYAPAEHLHIQSNELKIKGCKNTGCNASGR